MRDRPRPPRWFPLAFGAIFFVATAVVLALSITGSGDEESRRLAPGRGSTSSSADPLAWREGADADLEQRAAAGLSHVLYAKSPGGVFRTAARVSRFRADVDRVARTAKVDPDLLEALVFLESGGQANARASDDLQSAAGLTQILAETGRNLLAMRVDVETSERLTRGIARGRKVARRERLRRKVDERFDPRKAIEATGRYLVFAKEKLGGRQDLAFVSYHMGVGNLQRALGAYGEGEISYARLFFDSTPVRHAGAWSILAALGDDSSTYLWRLYAAREIMRLWRTDQARLNVLAVLHANRNSAEEVLHPLASTPTYPDPFALGRARAGRELLALDAKRLAQHGLRIDSRMGELADRVKQSPRLYRALRPEALALALYLGAATKEISGDGPLVITSTVRDLRYQRVLARRNIEATRAYSLHTTGWAFDVSRAYRSRKQALAFQFWLDRLQALDLIAWVREPGAIHVTVGPRAGELTAFVRR